MNDWWIFKGTGKSSGESGDDPLKRLPDPPSWRRFADEQRAKRRGESFQVSQKEIEMVNAALYLRRPLLVTGKPGTGKSSLIYAVAEELDLGRVLTWPINTRTTLTDGLYRYDAIARLQDAQLNEKKTAPPIGRYLRLGPLGTALLPSDRPRVLLIDEIDKSDIDLPNDLLHIFEEGEFVIPELTRHLAANNEEEVKVMTDDDQQVSIEGGRVRCNAFPFIVMTSNGERDFPPAFLRRCLQLEIKPPSEEKLAKIVEAHLGPDVLAKVRTLIKEFVKQRRQARGNLPTDQLLNAIYLTTRDVNMTKQAEKRLIDALLQQLGSIDSP